MATSPHRADDKAVSAVPASATSPRTRLRSRIRASAPMLAFVGRRLLGSLVVLIGATFIVYMLLAYSLDPLEDLRTSTAENREQLIEARMQELDLYTPPPIRYLKWVGGVLGYLIGQGTLGSSWQSGQSVEHLLAVAIPSSFQLVAAATVIAILLGVTVGVVSALRQYTGFDYGVTFMAFLLYSLPSFWVAVLLKLWGAVGFNDFLRDPTVSLPTTVVIAVVAGALWQAIVAGDRRRRLVVFVASAAITGGLVSFISATGWLLDPSLGLVVITLLGAAVAFGLSALLAGLHNRKALWSGLTMVGAGAALYFPLQLLFDYATGLMIVGLGLATVVLGLVVGWLFGGPDRAQSMRVAAITGVVIALLIFIDRVMQVWQIYSRSNRIGGRPIATIGAQTPGLRGDYWVMSLDTFTHLLLPTIALILISFASYTRYSRASLLEVMNQDYIRTARAKGLPERLVTVRHAFRNALIPLATIIPLDIANIFSGAIITERIFAWSGMGTLFLRSLELTDSDPIMGYFLVVATLLVVANIVVDFVYAALDPRIRVNA